MVKKVIQQGRSHFGARSVLPVREHGKTARTPLVAFFNIPMIIRIVVFNPDGSGHEPTINESISENARPAP